MSMFPSRSNPLGRDWSELDQRAREAVIAERESDLRRMKDGLYAPASLMEEMDESMPLELCRARNKMVQYFHMLLTCPLDIYLEKINNWSVNYRVEWMKAKSDCGRHSNL